MHSDIEICVGEMCFDHHLLTVCHFTPNQSKCELNRNKKKRRKKGKFYG